MEVSSLWILAQTGEKQALERLCSRLHRLVLTSRTFRAIAPDDREDLVQEVLTSILRKLRLMPCPRNLSAFVSYRAWSVSRRLRRARARRASDDVRPDSGDAGAAAPWRQLVGVEESRALRSCIGQLPQDQGESVRRRFQQGESVRDIAGAMGVSHATVYKRLELALASLHFCLKAKGIQI